VGLWALGVWGSFELFEDMMGLRVLFIFWAKGIFYFYDIL